MSIKAIKSALDANDFEEAVIKAGQLLQRDPKNFVASVPPTQGAHKV